MAISGFFTRMRPTIGTGFLLILAVPSAVEFHLLFTGYTWLVARLECDPSYIPVYPVAATRYYPVAMMLKLHIQSAVFHLHVHYVPADCCQFFCSKSCEHACACDGCTNRTNAFALLGLVLCTSDYHCSSYFYLIK